MGSGPSASREAHRWRRAWTVTVGANAAAIQGNSQHQAHPPSGALTRHLIFNFTLAGHGLRPDTTGSQPTSLTLTLAKLAGQYQVDGPSDQCPQSQLALGLTFLHLGQGRDHPSHTAANPTQAGQQAYVRSLETCRTCTEYTTHLLFTSRGSKGPLLPTLNLEIPALLASRQAPLPS